MMDRADKIFTILAALGLVAVLLWQRGAGAGVRVNASALPGPSDTGPAYLLSALPARRNIDDYQAPVSYFEKDAF